MKSGESRFVPDKYQTINLHLYLLFSFILRSVMGPAMKPVRGPLMRCDRAGDGIHHHWHCIVTN